MKTLTVKLPANLNARLSRAAKQRGATKSDVVREALETLLNGSSRDQLSGSALKLAGDLAGCIEGPGDLSTNPRYMDGLGK
jgi:predicted transcriptional regulator